MSCSFRRFFFHFIFIFIIIISIVFGFAYRILSKTTGKVFYSEQRKKKDDARRERLKTQYGAQSVSFTTEDGVRLAGLLVVRPNASQTILMCHGYKGTKEQMQRFLIIFPQDNILLFDFRAHGQSNGDLVTLGCLEEKDVHAAFSFLRNNKETKNLPIVGLGISMGAASLIHAASLGLEFEKLILDSSFASLLDHIGESFVWRTGLSRFPFMFFASHLFKFSTGLIINDFNPYVQIQSVDCPVFVIHAQNDKMIPVAHAHKIYENANKKKLLWIASSEKHACACRDCYQTYKQKVHDFLDFMFA